MKKKNLSGLWWKSGSPHPMIGKRHSILSKQKISDKNKGKEGLKGNKNPMYGVCRSGKDAPYYGKEHSEESKRKISKTLKEKYVKGLCKKPDRSGKNNSQYGRKGRLSPNFGRKHSEDSKRKMAIEKFGEMNPAKRPEVREKIKEWRKTFVLPLKDTSIEVKVQDFLKQLGIEYFTHQYMGITHGYQCDILIPSMNMVVECDGDYWHKYPIGNEVDHIRTKELIEKGFNVLRLWEHEINTMSINCFETRLKDKHQELNLNEDNDKIKQ